MRPTFSLVEDLLHSRFGGVLLAGAHAPDGEACTIELAHAACGDPWSDRPDRWPDIRPLNDARWSCHALRTTQMMRVLDAYWDWYDWSTSRRQRCVDSLAIETVRQLVAGLPGLPPDVRRDCRASRTLAEAAAAAGAAAAAVRAAWARAEVAGGAAEWASAAAKAAEPAARAASAAAEAADRAAGAAAEGAAEWAAGAAEAAAEWAAGEADGILILACGIWIEAAQASIQE